MGMGGPPPTLTQTQKPKKKSQLLHLYGDPPNLAGGRKGGGEVVWVGASALFPYGEKGRERRDKERVKEGEGKKGNYERPHFSLSLSLRFKVPRALNS